MAQEARELVCMINDSHSVKGIVITANDFTSGALGVIKKRSSKIFPVGIQTIERGLLSLTIEK